jgi:hypothetical protein
MSRDFLFSRPNFWSGVARVLDLGSTLNEYNYSISPEKADFRAIQSDWKTVGNDILKAMELYGEETANDGEE